MSAIPGALLAARDLPTSKGANDDGADGKGLNGLELEGSVLSNNGMPIRSSCCSKTRGGAHAKKGRQKPPLLDPKFGSNTQRRFDQNSRYCSLPMKPSFETLARLMIANTSSTRS